MITITHIIIYIYKIIYICISIYLYMFILIYLHNGNILIYLFISFILHFFFIVRTVCTVRTCTLMPLFFGLLIGMPKAIVRPMKDKIKRESECIDNL